MDLPPALLDAAQRGDLGTVIRLARRRLVMTQADLAATLGYSQAAISRIERGTGGNAHDVRTLRSLASALEIPGALLGLADPLSKENDPMHRRDFLRVTTATAALAASGGDILSPGRIGRSELADMQQTIDDLRTLDQQTGGDRLQRLATMHARQVRTLLIHASYSADIGRQLSGVLGEAAILVGWLAFDGGHPQESVPHYTEAITAAGAADDPLVAAHAYANLSMLALAADQPQRAVQFAQAGQRSATRLAGPRLRALLFAREAQAHALNRDRSAASDAIRRADRAFTSSQGHDPTWTAFFTQAELSGAAGIAFRMLGEPSSGTNHLQDAAGLDGPIRNRTSWVLHFADSLTAAGDYDQACAVAAGVVPTIADLSSTRVRRHLRDVAGSLAPHVTTPDGREFQDRVAALALAS